MKILLSVCLGLSLHSFASAATLAPLSKTHVDPDSFAGGSAGNVDAPKGSVTGCTFSADGTRIVAGDFKATIRCYTLAAGGLLSPLFSVIHAPGPFKGPDGEVGPAMFSPEGDFFATGINHAGVKIWSVAAGIADPDHVLQPEQYSHHFTPTQTCDGANWSPDGKWFAAGDNLGLKVYERPGFTAVASFTHPGKPQWEVNSVDFVSDPATGEMLLISGSGSGTSGTVLLHRYRQGKWVEEYRHSDSSEGTAPPDSKWLGGIGGSVKSVRFSPDGKLWAIGCRSSVVRIYRTDTGAQVANLSSTGNKAWLPGDDADPNAAVEAIEWSACGGYFFHGGLIDGVLRIWRRDDWSLVGWQQMQCTLGPVEGRSDEGLRAIEFIDVRGDLVLVGGDEGTAQIARFEAPVLEAPFQQASEAPSLVAMEAEAAHNRVAQGLYGPVTTFTDSAGATRNVRSVKDGVRHWRDVSEPDASLGKVVQALPNDGGQAEEDPQTNNPRVDSPKLDFRIQFSQTGTHYVWIRGFSSGANDNSCHIGLNGVAPFSGRALNFATPGKWLWSGGDSANERRTINVPTAGLHTLNVWMREAGLKIDQVVVTKDPNYIPEGTLMQSPRSTNESASSD